MPSETGVVAALTHEGAGVVHAGKAAFVAGALPGEMHPLSSPAQSSSAR
jgi:tRNA/tmRNA/rRNA uracil-C5-methylase (TrmA/RlmC/RlmD family)